MIELLQISCLMNYLWPQLESHLGKGKLLDEIADMWSLGFLSWIGKIGKTMHIWDWKFQGLEYCGFEIPLYNCHGFGFLKTHKVISQKPPSCPVLPTLGFLWWF